MTKAEQPKQDMGTGSVKKLMVKMAVPALVGQVVNLLYNVVDRIYIGHIPEIGGLALTGVGLFTPILMLITASAMLSGAGGAPRAAIAMGQGDKNTAEKIMGNCFTVLLLLAVLLTTVFYFAAPTLLRLFGASDATLPYAVEYGRIYILGSVSVLIVMGMNTFITTQGFASMSMLTTVIGAGINIILDPIFIHGKFGVPAMGVAGAAVATVIGQWIGAALCIYMNVKHNPDVMLKLKYLKPRKETLSPILAVGIPALIMNSIGSVMNFGMNQIFQGFQETATGVFGIYYKLQSFFFKPLFGINNATISIIAYNYGARRPERMTKTLKIACATAFCFMLAGLAAFQLLPDMLLNLFNPSEEFMSMGVMALRIISIHFPVAAFCIMLGASFQALGNGIYSTIVSLCRQLFVLLPVAYLLSLTGNVNNVWWSFPIAEVVSAAVTFTLFRRLYLNKIKPLF